MNQAFDGRFSSKNTVKYTVKKLRLALNFLTREIELL